MFTPEVVAEIENVARQNDVDADALLAAVYVESRGKPWTLVDGTRKPVILFEPHVFWRNLTSDEERAQATEQGLGAPKWRDLPYAKTQAEQYDRLERAARINARAAHAACSWGVGQVLGENATKLGYAGPEALAVKAMGGLRG